MYLNRFSDICERGARDVLIYAVIIDEAITSSSTPTLGSTMCGCRISSRASSVRCGKKGTEFGRHMAPALPDRTLAQPSRINMGSVTAVIGMPNVLKFYGASLTLQAWLFRVVVIAVGMPMVVVTALAIIVR